MVYIEACILVLAIGFLLYKWSTAKYGVWKERGVPHNKPLPLIGNFNLRVLFAKTSILQATIDSYMEFKDNKMYGIYHFRDPMLMVRDLELIKKITIRDFDSFPNHRRMFNIGEDHSFSKTLFAIRDRKWKEMRNILTPSFTGNKVRLMFELVNECSIEGVKYLEGEVQATGKDELDIEMRDYFTRYTNDVIASTAFGIKVNSFKDKTNEFYTIGTKVAQFRSWMLVKAMLFGLIPKVMKALRVQIMDDEKVEYFNNLVADAMTYRKEHNIIRPDMVQLLMEAKRNLEETKSDEHLPFNDEDLLAQCFIFFLAGFETVSVCLCYTLHQLMINPDIQQRLYEEILETDKELNGQPLNYDTLMKMKYMDMVLAESLRKWPPAHMMDRECVADYKLTDEDDNLLLEIRKKDIMLIPVIALHYDPEHFDKPELFDPDRFSDENKQQIKPMSYLPFGAGPRNCIGNRLALMETKSILYHMLLKFKVLPAEKSVADLMSLMKGFQLQPDVFWMKFLPRQREE